MRNNGNTPQQNSPTLRDLEPQPQPRRKPNRQTKPDDVARRRDQLAIASRKHRDKKREEETRLREENVNLRSETELLAKQAVELSASLATCDPDPDQDALALENALLKQLIGEHALFLKMMTVVPLPNHEENINISSSTSSASSLNSHVVNEAVNRARDLARAILNASIQPNTFLGPVVFRVPGVPNELHAIKGYVRPDGTLWGRIDTVYKPGLVTPEKIAKASVDLWTDENMWAHVWGKGERADFIVNPIPNFHWEKPNDNSQRGIQAAHLVEGARAAALRMDAPKPRDWVMLIHSEEEDVPISTLWYDGLEEIDSEISKEFALPQSPSSSSSSSISQPNNIKRRKRSVLSSPPTGVVRAHVVGRTTTEHGEPVQLNGAPTGERVVCAFLEGVMSYQDPRNGGTRVSFVASIAPDMALGVLNATETTKLITEGQGDFDFQTKILQNLVGNYARYIWKRIQEGLCRLPPL